MKNTAFYNALIRGIEKVYKKISLIVLRKRMDGYRKQESQSFNSYANDIKSPLSDCVESIISNKQDEPGTRHNNDSSILNTTTSQNSPANSHADKPHVADKRNAGEFSRHYKERANGSELHPDIAKKLEHSIWEHIHATIRYARQGDKFNAAMHTDIANSACKELAHYMTGEHYQEFIMQIEEHLASLKPD